jgi:peroxiredoxin
MRRLAGLGLLLVACALIAGCSGSGLGDDAPPPQATPEAERRPAPDFSLQALDGSGRITLASLRGKPTLINFWASWCEPCKRETPALVAFSKAHPRMQVLGIASDDVPDDSRAFARRNKIPYDLAVDRNGALLDRYELLGLPGTVVIDAEGRIVSVLTGEISADDLELLAGQLGV